MSLRELCLNLLFCCVHCESSSDRDSFPLCAECLLSLRGSRSCQIELGQPVDDASALYALNDENYAILKSWKKRRSPAFDRQVLNPVESLEWPSPLPEIITVIPQSLSRALRLGESPAIVIAEALSRKLGIPLRLLLEKMPGVLQKRQAELDHWERLLSPMEFVVVSDEPLPKSVILVDDFITTGHTVREAARALKRAGVRTVYAFGLGARSDASAEAVTASGRSRSRAC